MRRRAALAPQSLTSLVDVLFILVFAALVQRAAASAPATAPTSPQPAAPAPATWTPPRPLAELRAAAEAELSSSLREQPVIVARISARGVLTSLEVAPGAGGALAGLVAPAAGAAPSAESAPAAQRLALELALIERVADPDIAVAYIGARDPAHRICNAAAARLGSLARSLVIVSVDAPMSELMLALAAGLRRDVDHCLIEHRAAAVLLDSAALGADAPTSGSPAGAGGSMSGTPATRGTAGTASPAGTDPQGPHQGRP